MWEVKIQLFYLQELKVDSFHFLMYIFGLLVRQVTFPKDTIKG